MLKGIERLMDLQVEESKAQESLKSMREIMKDFDFEDKQHVKDFRYGIMTYLTSNLSDSQMRIIIGELLISEAQKASSLQKEEAEAFF